MSLSDQRTIVGKYDNSKLAISFLAVIVVLGLFVVGYDQGHIFSLVQGSEAFDMKFLHEVTHDMRHAAGFPCH